jgi:hypothetical protein
VDADTDVLLDERRELTERATTRLRYEIRAAVGRALAA